MTGTAPFKKRLSFDFDGVLHSYTSGWKGATVIPDPPVPGMAAALHRLVSLGWDVSICSSRARSREGVEAIDAWLLEHGFPPGLLVTSEKLPAELYIDDRALRFDGCVPVMLEAIDSWKGPWNLGAQIPGK